MIRSSVTRLSRTTIQAATRAPTSRQAPPRCSLVGIWTPSSPAAQSLTRGITTMPVSKKIRLADKDARGLGIRWDLSAVEIEAATAALIAEYEAVLKQVAGVP